MFILSYPSSVMILFFVCSTVSVTLICEKTQPPFPELSQQVGPTSTNKGFNQSLVVRHKECNLCQLMTSQSMFGPARLTRFAETFICRTGPKHVLQFKVKLTTHVNLLSCVKVVAEGTSCTHKLNTLLLWRYFYISTFLSGLDNPKSGR